MTSRFTRAGGWFCLGILSLFAMVLVGCSDAGNSLFNLGGGGAAPPGLAIPKFAYVVNFWVNNVTTYSIHPVTGALTEVGTELPVGNIPLAVTADPSGKFVYVANASADSLTTFSIDQTTGALTDVGTVTPAGDGPRAIAILGN